MSDMSTMNNSMDQSMDQGMQSSNVSAPQANTKIDDKAVKKIVGEAVAQVDGVLGSGGGFANMLKSDDDVSTGISVSLSEDNHAEISMKLIAEYGKNIPKITEEISSKVAEALDSMAGITVDKLDVEIVDTMTQEKFNEKYNRGNQN